LCKCLETALKNSLNKIATYKRREFLDKPVNKDRTNLVRKYYQVTVEEAKQVPKVSLISSYIDSICLYSL
ncbi:hypothetical protein L9F63_027191, partial [Diploptera punctata]